MGKWSYLKETLPKPPVDAKFQQKVDALKAVYAGYALDRLVDVYDEVNAARDDAKQVVSEAGAQLDALEAVLVSLLEARGESLVRFPGKGSVSLLDAPVVEVEDAAAFHAWVDATCPDVWQVYAATRDKLAKDKLEEGSPLPPGLAVNSVRTTISRRNT